MSRESDARESGRTDVIRNDQLILGFESDGLFGTKFAANSDSLKIEKSDRAAPEFAQDF